MQNRESKKLVIKNIKELMKSRAEFFELLDENIPKFGDTDVFDFANANDVHIKDVYAKFYNYDYAIRKLLPYLYEAYGVKFNV